jgi:hypothetical protein
VPGRPHPNLFLEQENLQIYGKALAEYLKSDL